MRALRKIAILSCSMLCLYIAIYVPMSLHGAYVVEFSGKHEYTSGFRIPDLQRWYPWPFHSSSTNLVYLFYPLIFIDRQIFHEDISLLG